LNEAKPRIRRNSLRYPGYDYSQPGCVSVTVRTHHRQRLFGVVADGLMRLSPQGSEVERIWLEIADRSSGVIVDAVVVMPDHLHGILMTGTDPSVETRDSVEEIVHDFKVRFRAAYRRHVDAGVWSPYATKLWQRSYFDRIIHSDRQLQATRDYIFANPARWQARQDNAEG
jgi:REP element-mobilizing transposase RayT